MKRLVLCSPGRWRSPWTRLAVRPRDLRLNLRSLATLQLCWSDQARAVKTAAVLLWPRNAAAVLIWPSEGCSCVDLTKRRQWWQQLCWSDQARAVNAAAMLIWLNEGGERWRSMDPAYVDRSSYFLFKVFKVFSQTAVTVIKITKYDNNNKCLCSYNYQDNEICQQQQMFTVAKRKIHLYTSTYTHS